MSFANLKMGTRLALGFGTVLALMVLLAVSGLSRMAQIQGELDDITQDNMVKMSHLYSMQGNLNSIAIAVRNIALLLDEEAMVAQVKNIEKARENYDKHAKDLTSMIKTESDKALLAKIEEARIATQPTVDKATRLGRDNKRFEATQVLLYEVQPNQSKWLEELSGMIASQEKYTAEQVETAHSAYDSARMLVILLAVTALVLGALISWFITRSVVVQIGGEPAYVVEVVKRVAGGDMTAEVQTKDNDNSSMLYSIKDMVNNIAGIIGEVRSTTDSISTAAREIASGTATCRNAPKNKPPAWKRRPAAWKN